ncbi:alpha/beta hydrolase [Quadrisphaera sp. GCM10027208]|uniref:alpha/beta hydrolase n=1 Tax=Quadrisphaera sp. GCM10027208 TaxID=3273423 RepID=UPI00360AB8F7
MTPQSETSRTPSPLDAVPDLDPGWRREVLHTADRLRLAAYVRQPAGAPRAAVVLVHGFTATGQHPEVLAQADVLADEGFAVVTYDGRGHGASEGWCTMGDDERHDVAAAVALARLQHPQVVLVGASMGAVAALRYAASDEADDAVRGVVAVSAPAQWRLPFTVIGALSALQVRTRVGRWFLARHASVRVSPHWASPEPPHVLVSRLTMPVTVLHGMLDHVMRPRAARLLYAAAGEPRQLVLVDRMGHAFDPQARTAISAAVRWTLAAAATPV